MAKTGRQSEDDVDALFRLPLGEFVAERKALAARLKKDGQATASEDVKSLAKPSISAWTVNQLYWQHREAFDQLLATGQRFRKSQSSGKVADMREALNARRESLARLETLATSLLQDTGHNPTLDIIRRITTTLEAVSAYEVLPDGSSPGRMTKDVDPPGFESLASFVATPGTAKRNEAAKRMTLVKASEPRASSTRPVASPRTKTANKESRHEDQRRANRLANIAAAKTAVANARKVLTAARAKAQNLKATQTKFDAAAKKAETHRRELEQRFMKAGAAAEAATERAHAGKTEMDEANKALENAESSVEDATKKLDSLSSAD